MKGIFRYPDAAYQEKLIIACGAITNVAIHYEYSTGIQTGCRGDKQRHERSRDKAPVAESEKFR
jgi:hypothetical protein